MLDRIVSRCIVWCDITFSIPMNSPFYQVKFDIDIVNPVELWGPVLQNEKKKTILGFKFLWGEDQLRVSPIPLYTILQHISS